MYRSTLFLLAAALCAFGTVQHLQAQAIPPGKVDYQGILLDSSGQPLAPTAPANYTVVFRIWDASSNGNLIWAESQNVTVSNGKFSVQLGNGSNVTSPAVPQFNAAQIASAFGSSERYLGLTVTIPSSPGTSEIVPRLQFLTNPFSFVAARAQVADNVVTGTGATTNLQGTTNVSGAVNVVGAGSVNLTGTGNISVSGGGNISVTGAGGFVGKGTGLTALNASNIASGTLADARLTANVPLLNRTQTFTGINNFGVTRVATLEMKYPTTVNRNWAFIVNNANNLEFLYLDPVADELFASVTFSTTGQVTSSSDRKLKKDIAPMPSVMDRLMQLQPVTYRFKSQTDDSPKSLGFIAQDVEPFFPEVVSESRGSKGIAYSELIPVAIAAIQEEHARREEFDKEKDARLDKLQQQNDALQRRLEAIEAKLKN